jgi:transcriptional regulator with XRE-family HTH domain
MKRDSLKTCMVRWAGVSSVKSRRKAARSASPSGVQFPALFLGFTSITVQLRRRSDAGLAKSEARDVVRLAGQSVQFPARRPPDPTGPLGHLPVCGSRQGALVFMLEHPGWLMAGPRGQKEASRALALGALLRKLRRERGYTLDQLASRIPMSASNLSRLELGSQGPPADEVIERLAAALEAPESDLLRAAGREDGSRSFEQAVLDRLDAIRRDVREVKAAVMDRQG